MAFNSRRTHRHCTKHARSGVHPGITCDGCERPVRGLRFKCVTCPDYDLCSTCENRALHQEHNMIEIQSPVRFGAQTDAANVVHPGICCDVCDVGIRGIRFKCRVCPDYDLCSRCIDKSNHLEHSMMQINKPQTGTKRLTNLPHPGIWCDVCEVNIQGARYKCRICPDYDLCSKCEAKNSHPEHPNMQMYTPDTQVPVDDSRLFHLGIFCDGCGSTICGLRYKCLTCPDHDLCSLCELKGLHTEHSKMAIPKPILEDFQPVADTPQGVPHPGIFCDGCQVGIHGARYKCRICPDYDLCAICKGKGFHPEHTKILIETPRPPRPGSDALLHVGVTCDECEGSVWGTRYKCTSCPDYDLCSTCREDGIHPLHNFVEITDPTAPVPHNLPLPAMDTTEHQPAVNNSPGLGSSNQQETVTGSTEAEEDPMTCGICFERKKESFIIPCGHTLCTVCAVSVNDTSKLCPFCRKKIQSIGKIYF